MFLFSFLFEFTFNLKKVSVGRRFRYEQNIDGHVCDHVAIFTGEAGSIVST